MKNRAAIAVALAGILTAGLWAQSRPAPSATVVPGRSKIATSYGIVAASQPLAARAGVQILERGGNAIDAAIATNAVMGLVEPHNNGIGGDLFAIVYEARTKKLYGLNAGGWAPTGLTPAFLRSKGIDAMPQQRHLHGDRARRGRGLGGAAHAVRHAADVRPAGAGDLLRRRRLSGDRRDRGSVGAGPQRSWPPNQNAAQAVPRRRPRAESRRDVQESRAGRDAAARSRTRARPASTKARPPTRSSPSRARRAAP